MQIPSRAWGFVRAGLNGRYGVRLADAPVGGDHPSLLAYPGVWTEPTDADTEVVFVPETLPAQGTLTVYADSSYIHGPITGSDPWTCRVYYVSPGSNAAEASGSPATITDTGGAGPTLVSIADSGQGAEQLAVVVAAAIGDAGAGADGFGNRAALVPLSDAGAGADALQLAAAVSLAETAAGAEAVTAEDVTGAPPPPPPPPLVALTDAAQGVDSVVVAVVALLADAGGGVDVVSLPPPPGTVRVAAMRCSLLRRSAALSLRRREAVFFL